MTRETKVGLLVGLAFIILFGVVISESADRRTGEPLDQLVQQPAPSPTISEPAVRPGNLAEPSRREILAGEAAAREAANLLEGRGGQMLAAVDGPNIDTLPGAGARREVTYGPRDDLADSPLLERVDAAHAGVAGGIHRMGETSQPVGAGGGSAAGGIVDGGPTGGSGAVARAAVVEHVVTEGETLSSISRKYYGTDREWKRIQQANASVLPTERSMLRVGMRLVIPDRPAAVAGAAAAPAGARPAGGGTAAAAGGARAPGGAGSAGVAPTASGAAGGGSAGTGAVAAAGGSEAAFRLYTVKRGDNLFLIARRELGDGGRHREIFELNRGSMSSESVLREGQRIRLPLR